MKVSIAQARRELSQILKQIRRAPVVVTRRGRPDAVILSFQEYERLRRLRAYLKMMHLSRELEKCGATASELYDLARRDLEERP
jgi:prevent-host-death family protein